MKSPILGSSYVARSVNAADNRMVNLFPETIPEGGKEAGFLNRVPGLRRLATVGTGPIRGLRAVKDKLYVVSGSEMYQVDSAWKSKLLGTVIGDTPACMSDNGTQIFIAANPTGYTYNIETSVFSIITDSDFPGAATVGFIDGYFVFNEPNTQKLWITGLYDGTALDALDFASAEGTPDNLLAVAVDHREVWTFGANSIEVWQNTGNTDFPLERISGAFNEIGCAAAYSVAKLDNGLFWLGADDRGRGIVYRSAGYRGVRISTHAVEWQIQQYETIADAVAYSYQQDGHSFYVLNFPTADKTWVYDVATGAWHERASFVDGQFIRHRPSCQVSFNNELVVGDFENGKLYAYDFDSYTEDGAIQKWLRTWRALPTGQNNLHRTAHHSLQLDMESGAGIDGEQFTVRLSTSKVLATEIWQYLRAEDSKLLLIEGADSYERNGPIVMLRWSDDGGHTWSNEHYSDSGPFGEYNKRVIWRRLGMTLKLRDRVYEVSGTDETKIAIVGAEILLSPTHA